ncbi:MAG: hypothetical protein Q7T74_02160 [Candidatus Saccharibacteria bacterium]|nr:hypothetical protein [Candidatus Saccharibacteria bacterium]
MSDSLFHGLVIGGLGLIVLILIVGLVKIKGEIQSCYDGIESYLRSTFLSNLTSVINDPGDKYWQKFGEQVWSAINAEFNEDLSGRMGGRVKKSQKDLEKILLMVALLTSAEKLALPYHGIDMLGLDENLSKKLKGAQLITIYKLNNWLKNDTAEKQITGIGTKEIKTIQKAVDKYFDEFTLVAVP